MNDNEFRETIEEFRPDVCIDLAWEDIKDNSDYALQRNIEAKSKMMNLIGKIGVSKIVMCGSCWEYGKRKGELQENHEGFDLNNFGKSKCQIYDEARSIFKGKDTSLIWARIFYSYGYGQRGASLIPYIYKKIKNNEQVILKDKNGAHDFVHVSDVAKAIKYLAISNIDAGIYNIGTGSITSNEYILNKIID